jgi:hypothetical protein
MSLRNGELIANSAHEAILAYVYPSVISAVEENSQDRFSDVRTVQHKVLYLVNIGLRKRLIAEYGRRHGAGRESE